MEESRLVVGTKSEAGNVRERNEDLVYFNRLENAGDDTYVLAVADGMGGYDRGDVASQLAIDALLERLNTLDTDDSALVLKQAYRRANEEIFEGGVSQGEENMMGTTLVAGLIRGNELSLANVGDSRGYLLRAGALTQVTQDHSLIAEQVRMGVLTEEEARSSQHRNIITRALGHRERVDVDVFELTLLPEDRLLLSTDGVHDYLEEDDIRDVLLELPPDEAPGELIERALANGSTDNLTALCAWMAPISVLEAPAEPEQAATGPSSMLVPLLAGAALVVVILVVIVLLFFA
ncbi:MAG: PP2C family serine/threonine-protein phosphatase [Thermomicrobiales bacterium]